MQTQLQYSCKVQVVDHIYPQFYEYIEERTETVLLGEGGGGIPLQCSAPIYEGRLG